MVIPRLSGVVDFPFRYPQTKDIVHEEFNVDYSEVEELYQIFGQLWFFEFLKNFTVEEKPNQTKRLDLVLSQWASKPKFKSLCKQVHSFGEKMMDTNPMMRKRIKYVVEYLKNEHGDSLSTKVPKLAIVTHAGFVKRFFNTKSAKNANAVIYDKIM